MFDLLLSLGWGTISMTREKAEKMVERFVQEGDLKRDDAKKIMKTLVERGEKKRKEFREYINDEILNLLQKSNLVTRNEFEELQERVHLLEQNRLEQNKDENE